MPKKKSNKKTQKQKQKQTVTQKVIVNLSKPKRVNRRRSQPPTREINVPQIVTQYIPIQSGSSVPSIVKYYNNIMTSSAKTEPVKDIQEVRQQQQENYTDAIRQSAQQEDTREQQQANAGIITSLVSEQDDMDIMKRAIIQQAEEYNKPKKKKKERLKIIGNLVEFSEIVKAGAGARRGRPAGSKNKSKEVLEQERLKKQAKRDARAKRREDILKQSGYITENPQTDVGDY